MLIQILECWNIFTDDILRSHEQFPVKIFVQKHLFLRYQKSLFLTQNHSTLFHYDKLTNFVYQPFEKSITKPILMTLVTYSDILTVFQKVDWRRLTAILNLRLYQTITDASFVRSLMIQYFI